MPSCWYATNIPIPADLPSLEAGFFLYRDVVLGLLCCRPDYAGTGVGAAICPASEEAAGVHDIRLLFVEASEAARCLRERIG